MAAIFHQNNKPHLCFHYLRVTYVNRNHSSELIHQVYQREKVEDVAQWRDAV
ncbi:MAG: hypothetical protein ACLQSR_12650 [Limisphaerales bacterium]